MSLVLCYLIVIFSVGDRWMKNNLRIIIQLIFGIWKSFVFNFHYFPLKQAIKFPVIISSNCKLDTLHGKCYIDAPVKTGMVLFGVGPSGLFDHRVDKSLLCLTSGGELHFKGNARFGPGTRIINNGKMIIGNNFTITGSTKIICSKAISFGNDVLISWDVLIMDKDYHKIVYKDHESEMCKPITIGNHVWIGCKSCVLKGSVIGNDSVVAAMTRVNTHFYDSNCLLAGIPGRIVKNNISWKR